MRVVSWMGVMEDTDGWKKLRRSAALRVERWPVQLENGGGGARKAGWRPLLGHGTLSLREGRARANYSGKWRA